MGVENQEWQRSRGIDFENEEDWQSLCPDLRLWFVGENSVYCYLIGYYVQDRWSKNFLSLICWVKEKPKIELLLSHSNKKNYSEINKMLMKNNYLSNY